MLVTDANGELVSLQVTVPFRFKSKANSYKIDRRRLRVDPIVKRQEADAAAKARSLMGSVAPLNTPVRVTVTVTHRDNRRFDLDGCFKSCFDSFNGIAYTDDKLIREIVAVKQLGSTDSTTVVIERI